MPTNPGETPKPTAVIGERELVLGFRLIGLGNTFLVDPSTTVRTFEEAFDSGRYGLILASQRLQAALPEKVRRRAESSLSPLVVFLPTPGAGEEPESLAALAKRVLGISLEGSLSPPQVR